jgi:hypothetical protein
VWNFEAMLILILTTKRGNYGRRMEATKKEPIKYGEEEVVTEAGKSPSGWGDDRALLYA